MTHAFRSPQDYEFFLYTLSELFESIRHSSLTLVRLGASLARVSGELQFDHDVRLVVRERLTFDRLPVVIESYGYELWRGEEKLYWYDSQPHPDEPLLRQSEPHHKHVPPDIKHNRIPASQMSFLRPNLPTLVQEIEGLIENIGSSPKP